MGKAKPPTVDEWRAALTEAAKRHEQCGITQEQEAIIREFAGRVPLKEIARIIGVSYHRVTKWTSYNEGGGR